MGLLWRLVLGCRFQRLSLGAHRGVGSRRGLLLQALLAVGDPEGVQDALCTLPIREGVEGSLGSGASRVGRDPVSG